MAGTHRGSIEHKIVQTSTNGTRNIFAHLYAFLQSHPNTTLVASYFGIGGATGMDVTGGANPAGEQAWAIHRWDAARPNGVDLLPFYSYIRWTHGSALGTAGGVAAPADHGVFLACACDSTGTSPWNGTTNADGTDVLGGAGAGPVWVANGGNLLVWPRCNSLGGTYVALTQAMAQWHAWDIDDAGRFQMYADDDSLRLYGDTEDTSGYNSVFIFGPVEMDGLTLLGPPLAMLCDDGLESQAISKTLDYGSQTVAGLQRDGGVAHPDSSEGVRTFRPSWDTNILNANPNVQGSYARTPINLWYNDIHGAGASGPAGQIKFVRLTDQIATLDTMDSLTWAIYGSVVANEVRFAEPGHDGVTVPGTGATDQGVQFP